MTTYRLSGTVIDSEGTLTAVSEFSVSANQNKGKLDFYRSNGFRGALIQIRTELDGSKIQETVNLESLPCQFQCNKD
ncbi:hypothetical protein [Pseudomonas corrugata]|uniref:hypothetical protein n=1 Tax=Pseudomonas corrugata TaxID=47879 RepID=UPI0006D89F2C|nr:hypothetical protein [Pseudomonas corrugata]